MAQADASKTSNDPEAITSKKRDARIHLETLLTSLGQKASSYALVTDDELECAVDHPKST